jgi:hypothetical protein
MKSKPLGGRLGITVSLSRETFGRSEPFTLNLNETDTISDVRT